MERYCASCGLELTPNGMLCNYCSKDRERQRKEREHREIERMMSANTYQRRGGKVRQRRHGGE